MSDAKHGLPPVLKPAESLVRAGRNPLSAVEVRYRLKIVERALGLVCNQFLGDDDIAVQGFLRQAEAEIAKEANHEQG